MKNTEVKKILRANFKPIADVNFEDVESATRNALTEYLGLEELSAREIRQKKDLAMALIEETIDEILPQKLKETIGKFAEVKSYGRDDEVVFEIKDQGRRRARLTITKGSRGGMYRSARLDSKNMTLGTWVETVAVFVTLEEILLGKYSLRDLMNNILEGFEIRIYKQVIQALNGADVPSNNSVSTSGFDEDSLDELISIISAYGSPMIIGFREVISKITNQVGFSSATPNIPEADINDIRKQGYVGTYKGVPVVQLENYIIDTDNTTWLLDPSYMYVLPTGTRPVKVALKGDLYIQPVQHATGSEEENAHKMLGVGMLLNNNVGIYEDSAIGGTTIGS